MRVKGGGAAAADTDGSDHDDEHDPAMAAAEALLRRRKYMTDEERRKERVAKEGVKQSIYLGYIHGELSNERACLELPLTILTLLCFSVFSMEMLRQEEVYAVEKAMIFDIMNNANFAFAHNFGHKTLMDVNSIADFWSWMRLGYLPLIFQPSWAYSEDYPASLGTEAYDGTSYGRPTGPASWDFGGYTRGAPASNDYLRYNKVLGGIKLHQTIAEASPSLCQLPSGIDRKVMEEWLGKPCVPSDDGVLTPEKRDADFGEMARVQWLFTELDSPEELNRVLIDMEDGCSHAKALGSLDKCRCTWCREQQPRQPWLDEQTRRVEIAFVVYNPVYGLYTYVGTNLFFNRGGHIHKFINVMSAWADIFNRPAAEVLPLALSGIVWILSVLYVFVGETREIISVVRTSEDRWWRAIKDDYLQPWNVVDCVSLAISFALIMLYIDLSMKTTGVNRQLVNVMEASTRATSEPPAISRQEYEEVNTAFYSVLEAMCASEQSLRYGLCLYPSILMLRLFKSFDAQPRLGIVTKTLQRATQDLIHFCIVFVCVFVCLMVNSVLFFGQDLQDFSTLPRAIDSCFRATFGDLDFEHMQQIGMLKTELWFWSFMLLMVIILLNMLLAVIMDAYTEEKARAKTAQTVMEQGLAICKRYMQYRRGERVRLNDIWDVFEKEYNGSVKAMLRGERMIRASFLTERVRHLQPKQARLTLETALAKHEADIEGNMTEEHKLKAIQECARLVEARVGQMMKDIEYMAERVRYYDRLQAPEDAEYDLHFGAEDHSETQAVSQAVSGLSQEISGLFVSNLKCFEDWQDSFERQQNELHGLVVELQAMVRQQACCVAAMSGAAAALEPGEEPSEAAADR